MLVKTAQLTSTQLNHAVAKCEEQRGVKFGTGFSGEMLLLDKYEFGHRLGYSTDWAQGGPIIAQHVDCIRKRSKAEEADLAYPNQNLKFKAEIFADIDGYYCGHGPTPLVAAMRCYVASKLGDEVDIPNNLCRI